ncbi:YXWGXW repeat-containing protein [bacterium]|nr:YXWGXW repeat-containing protein [bacterium]
MKGQSSMGERKLSRRLNVLAVPVLFAGLLMIIGGCARHRTVVVASPADVVKVVYVQKAPPALKAEVRPARPASGAVWVGGHWKWTGHKYTWVSGHWEKKPRGATWVSGHWEKKPRGWVWVQGHWRK